jgi:hypothetical protein
MYLVGRFAGVANIFKFSKNNFGQDWQVMIQDYTDCDHLKTLNSGGTLDSSVFDSSNCYADTNSKMHEITSMVQPPNSANLWTAGYMCRETTDCNKVAVVMKIDNDGEIQFLKQFGVQDLNAQTILATTNRGNAYGTSTGDGTVATGGNDWAE